MSSKARRDRVKKSFQIGKLVLFSLHLMSSFSTHANSKVSVKGDIICQMGQGKELTPLVKLEVVSSKGWVVVKKAEINGLVIKSTKNNDPKTTSRPTEDISVYSGNSLLHSIRYQHGAKVDDSKIVRDRLTIDLIENGKENGFISCVINR